MGKLIFALASEANASSNVHHASSDKEVSQAVEDLIRDGYNLIDIHSVSTSDVKPIKVDVNLHGE